MSALAKRPLFFRALVAVALELMCLLLLLALAAWLMAAEALPCAAQPLVVGACVFLSVFLGSNTICRGQGSGALTASGLCALALAALMLLGGALNESSATVWSVILKNAAVAISAALLGTIVQLRQIPGGKKRRKRRR